MEVSGGGSGGGCDDGGGEGEGNYSINGSNVALNLF